MKNGSVPPAHHVVTKWANFCLRSSRADWLMSDDREAGVSDPDA